MADTPGAKVIRVIDLTLNLGKLLSIATALPLVHSRGRRLDPDLTGYCSSPPSPPSFFSSRCDSSSLIGSIFFHLICMQSHSSNQNPFGSKELNPGVLERQS